MSEAMVQWLKGGAARSANVKVYGDLFRVDLCLGIESISFGLHLKVEEAFKEAQGLYFTELKRRFP